MMQETYNRMYLFEQDERTTFCSDSRRFIKEEFQYKIRKHARVQTSTQEANILFFFITPQPSRAVGVLFSPMVSGWAGGRRGKSLSGLYLRNRKV